MAKNKRPLSVTIIARNEADRIGRCIDSVAPIADEILVVDSGSTDGTQDVAARAGARVVFNPWTGFGPQKQFAERTAVHHWILNLDADEWVSPALAAEIVYHLNAAPEPKPFWRMKLLSVLPFDETPRWLAESHDYIRLYDRRKGGFPDSPVHDAIDAPRAQVGVLEHVAFHKSDRSIAHLAAKQIDYFRLQAKTFRRSRTSLLLRLPFEFPIVFVKYYFLRRYFTAGWYGLMKATTIAALRVVRLCILYSDAI